MQPAFQILAVSTVLASATAASQQPGPRSTIHKLDELNAPQIAALDRERTMFILPVGMVEQHGPHLPVGADTLAVVYEANGAAQKVARDLAGWSIVMMPAVNYGQSGANRLGGQRYHPGTYGIRQATLRSLVADIGAQLAENRFSVRRRSRTPKAPVPRPEERCSKPWAAYISGRFTPTSATSA